MKENVKKTYGTNYRVATQWMNNSYILCNEIVEKDFSVYENVHFPLEDEETGGDDGHLSVVLDRLLRKRC